MSPNYSKLLLGPKVSAATKSLLLLPPPPQKKPGFSETMGGWVSLIL